ncbi:hypothetical protein BC937DRAFT_88633 [Endogone sp. FLAS-F59071]|nr:hypothetical protein BC937DRAFT_88633 [Endogone sp. FLAS-F59071]|eukprot:RUS18547.1 hypothetical protein BC937DRAFT_88633 [Endogone sp. FLAS-F59071]
MNLVDDDESDEVSVAPVGGLARDHIPLFGRRDNDLRLGDLLLGQLPVARQLRHVNPVRLEPVTEIANHLLHQRLHRGDIHNLEPV